MTANVVSGKKKPAAAIWHDCRRRGERLGEDHAAAIYVANKVCGCGAAGISSTRWRRGADTLTVARVMVEQLNRGERVRSIPAQLPQPPEVDLRKALEVRSTRMSMGFTFSKSADRSPAIRLRGRMLSWSGQQYRRQADGAHIDGAQCAGRDLPARTRDLAQFTILTFSKASAKSVPHYVGAGRRPADDGKAAFGKHDRLGGAVRLWHGAEIDVPRAAQRRTVNA